MQEARSYAESTLRQQLRSRRVKIQDVVVVVQDRRIALERRLANALGHRVGLRHRSPSQYLILFNWLSDTNEDHSSLPGVRVSPRPGGTAQTANGPGPHEMNVASM